MAQRHVVQPGESLRSIAARYGFGSPERLHDHPDNAALKRDRPSPDLLHPGDEVAIPDHDATYGCATGATHRFRAQRPGAWLRLTVVRADGERITDARYTLRVGERTYRGRTDGDGKLERRIPVLEENATLTVDGYEWPLRIGHLNPIHRAPDDGVSGIQARLRNLGYDVGELDGELGPRTEAAIRAFQRHHGLTVDGTPSAPTIAKIEERHGV